MLSYLEISKENLLHNFAALKSLVRPEVEIISVIKANAYGHGQNEVAQILEEVTDYFQVDDLQELKLLREVSQKPTLVLGYVASEEIKEALSLEAVLCVYAERQIFEIEKSANSLGKIVNVHVKIDARLGRQGVLPEKVQSIVEVLKKCQHIRVQAAYCHFANIEDTADFSHAQKQIEVFEQVVAFFRKNGFENIKTHMSASSGVMVYENIQGKSGFIRPGLSLYGMWPCEELKKKLESVDFSLKPVMKWVSHIAQVKTLPVGHSIGYGLTFMTSRPTKIAIIPQGYSDGYDRGLSNKGEVLIGGSRCQVLGRVAMNMFVVDVSHLETVSAEDEVVLLGRQGKETISAEEIAEKIETINYEITTRISPLLKRIVC